MKLKYSDTRSSLMVIAPKFLCGSFYPNLAVSQKISDGLGITITEVINPIAKLISHQQMFNPIDRLFNLARSIPTPGDRRLTTRFANDVTDSQLFLCIFQVKVKKCVFSKEAEEAEEAEAKSIAVNEFLAINCASFPIFGKGSGGSVTLYYIYCASSASFPILRKGSGV